MKVEEKKSNEEKQTCGTCTYFYPCSECTHKEPRQPDRHICLCSSVILTPWSQGTELSTLHRGCCKDPRHAESCQQAIPALTKDIFTPFARGGGRKCLGWAPKFKQDCLRKTIFEELL